MSRRAPSAPEAACPCTAPARHLSSAGQGLWRAQFQLQRGALGLLHPQRSKTSALVLLSFPRGHAVPRLVPTLPGAEYVLHHRLVSPVAAAGTDRCCRTIPGRRGSGVGAGIVPQALCPPSLSRQPQQLFAGAQICQEHLFLLQHASGGLAHATMQPDIGFVRCTRD